ncbi:MAG TPA: glutamyl-tRNA reductase [Candidatus Sulfotelmatobacter sp.]|nr:glutamyl-tRNA reductase [Candidatus Sulfotelmatobacter sp.]
MESTLLVIGLNHRTAPMAMRERFWISEPRRYAVLRQLARAEGIEEVMVLTTSSRTEFLIWASEPTLAANSVLNFLSGDHGLKLSEWEHFYRLIEEEALAHIFRVTCGLDSPVLGEPEISAQVRTAWEQARTVAGARRVLDSVIEKALGVSEDLRKKTGAPSVSIASAAEELAIDVFEQLQGKRVLLLGAGKINQNIARHLHQNGAELVCVIDQSPELAQQLATELGGTAATLADRWKRMAEADILVCSSGCPHVILTRPEAERIARERQGAPLVILDIATPRDVDPEVRRVDGVLLCDLEGLERIAQHNAAARNDRNAAAAAAEAEKTVRAEAQAFSNKLQAESVVPTIVALRQRLDEIRRQDLESFIQERGPFTREQDLALHAITAQLVRRIANSLARELKELPEKRERERMTAAVQRLFHLETPKPALAGTRSETNQHEQRNHDNNNDNRPPIAVNS